MNITPGRGNVLLLATSCLAIFVAGLVLVRSAEKTSPTPVRPIVTDTSGSPNRVPLEASWAVGYHSLAELKQNADVAVVGVFTGIAGTATSEPPYTTDYTFTVSQVLWDPDRRVQTESLLIHQTGAVIDGRSHEIDDDPLFQIGEESILFLREYAPDRYLVIGGPSGRFRIEKDQIQTFGDGVKFDKPMSKAEFIEALAIVEVATRIKE